MTTNTDEQIRNRLRRDEDEFSDAFVSLSEVITDGELLGLFSDSRKRSSEEALAAVLRYYGCHDKIYVPDSVSDTDDYLDYVLNPLGIMRRTVNLDGDWYKKAFGAFLAVLEGGTAAALIPARKGYECYCPTTGNKFIVNRDNAGKIRKEAICFYIPFPEKELETKDVLRHIFRTVSSEDVIKIVAFSLAATLLSLLLPRITQHLFNEVAIQSAYRPLLAVFVLMVSLYVSRGLIDFGKDLTVNGLAKKGDSALYSAVTMRLIGLPAKFFRDHSAGSLHAKAEGSQAIASSVFGLVFGSGVTILMSLIYIFQIRSFSAILVIPSVLVILALALFIGISSLRQADEMSKIQSVAAEEQGFLVSAIDGIRKIRLTGSEKRVFARWANIYKDRAWLSFRPSAVEKYSDAITGLLSLAGSGLIYYFALKADVDAPTYMAFMTSYGLLSGGFLSLAQILPDIAGIRAKLQQLEPILKEVPESSASRRVVKQLTGKIDVTKVSFRYLDSQPLIIDRLSLSVKPGEYLGIVGKSGCGKSTLMRLLLGFEKPLRGGISYDSIDINSLEPRSLRRNIGCVMQDGGLFTASIKENITVSAPFATEEEIWRAARMAGIEEDIRNMPMGLETLVSDSAGTISGGQKQRILIARALISDPGILFFDEATSALDNNTQRIITDTLKSLACTRIVIAHRLSTVRDCDRIIVMENGNIAEEGGYEELMEKNGKFAALVKRQLIDPAGTGQKQEREQKA